MRKLIFTAGAVVALLFSSCVKDTIPSTVVIPQAPKVEQSAVPAIVSIKKSNDDLKEKVKEQSETIRQQKENIDDAIRGAELIKESLKAATPIDEKVVTDLVQNLNSVKVRNLFLETSNGLLQTELEKQAQLASDAQNLAKAKDEESQRWISVSNQKDVLINQLKGERDSAIKERDKSRIDSANSGVYKKWVFWIVGIFIAWTLAKNILMIYFPAARFRI